MGITPHASYYELEVHTDSRGTIVQVRPFLNVCSLLTNDQQYYHKTHNIHLEYSDIVGITLKGRRSP